MDLLTLIFYFIKYLFRIDILKTNILSKSIEYTNNFSTSDNPFVGNYCEDINFISEDYILAPLNELLNTFKKETEDIVKKCIDINNNKINDEFLINIDEDIKHNNKIDINKREMENKIIELNYKDIDKYINFFYIENVQKEILGNNLYIPIKILQSCIRSFIIKYHQLCFEIEDAFPRYYKHIKGFLKSLDTEFTNDCIRYLKKADIASIYI